MTQGMQRFSSKRLIICCRVRSIDERVRVSKLCQLLLNRQLDIEVWGLKSDLAIVKIGQQDIVWTGITSKGYGRLSKMIEYLSWMLKLFAHALKLDGNKNVVVWAVGLESLIPLVLASKILRFSVVFDHADNLAKSYKWPFVIKKAVETIEKYFAIRASIHLVPGRERWTSSDSNLYVVPNLPLRDTLEQAKHIAKLRNYVRSDDSLTLYVNGWLTSTRGIPILLKSMDMLYKKSVPVKIIIAGVSGCPEASELISRPYTEYYGQVSNAEAIALYFQAHFAFTFYDPAIEINRFAEPNKWGDCVITQTPILTNTGIVTSANYEKAGVCVTADYENYVDLAETIEAYHCDRSKWQRLKENYSALKADFWDERIMTVVNVVFHEGWKKQR